jgi:hypothetical protein
MKYEDNHRVALARELTYAAGVPLRDRYGFAASHEDVLSVVNIVFREPDDKEAADAIGLGNALNEHEIAMGYDEPTDEEYETKIVRALRPLVEERRQAAARSLY